MQINKIGLRGRLPPSLFSGMNMIRLWIKPFPEPLALYSAEGQKGRGYDAAECYSIRRAFRTSGPELDCPRHPGHALKVTWVEKTPLPNGAEMPTFLQVVCEKCGFTSAIDMMESDPPSV